jgi:hypothetical protein
MIHHSDNCKAPHWEEAGNCSCVASHIQYIPKTNETIVAEVKLTYKEIGSLFQALINKGYNPKEMTPTCFVNTRLELKQEEEIKVTYTV